METLLTKEILDCMQKIGDPVVDPHVTTLLNGNDEDKRGLLELHQTRLGRNGLAFLKDEWLTTHARDYGVERFSQWNPAPSRIQTSSRRLAISLERYGSEIAAALLLAALPEAYAAGEGAKVLFRAQPSFAAGGGVSTRRILATAQFVISVCAQAHTSAPVSDDMSKSTYQSFDDTRRLWDPKGPGSGTSRGRWPYGSCTPSFGRAVQSRQKICNWMTPAATCR